MIKIPRSVQCFVLLFFMSTQKDFVMFDFQIPKIEMKIDSTYSERSSGKFNF